jgi:hypothetical protein
MESLTIVAMGILANFISDLEHQVNPAASREKPLGFRAAPAAIVLWARILSM